jgi:16S rRNA (guanine(527)-N(7))-methyltransferase RsmG
MNSAADFERNLKDRLGSEAPGPDAASLLFQHYEVMLKWNRVMSLTTVETLDQAVERHYCESLYLAARLPESAGAIADVGSGAGFPGFPVAVVRPDAEVWLIESSKKKASFLREACAEAKNIHVFAGRAEDFRELVDWVISRAVRPLDVLKIAAGLKANVGLLIGEADAVVVAKDERWTWVVDSLPWGERSRLALGRCSTWNVPRETCVIG